MAFSKSVLLFVLPFLTTSLVSAAAGFPHVADDSELNPLSKRFFEDGNVHSAPGRSLKEKMTRHRNRREESAALEISKRFDRRKSSSITFSDPRAKDFYVDGSSIPLVDFDAGPSYAGLIPIAPNSSQELFFWFWPADEDAITDDLIYWTNGGPGCSSMEGFLQENGPLSWKPGTPKISKNPHSWTKLGHVIWVEDPVGTGFTQGNVTITDDTGFAQEVTGFFQQFLDIFKELKGKNFWTTGESYGGMYIPYLAHYIYNNVTKEEFDLNLKGSWIGDPIISDFTLQAEIPALGYAKKFNGFSGLQLNQTLLDKAQAVSDQCGFTGWLDEHLTYPPKGSLPRPKGKLDPDSDDCDVFDLLANAATDINPAFDIYHIVETPPIIWNVLGFPGSDYGLGLYFNRSDVQKTLHVPPTNWADCSAGDVFAGDGSDLSPSANLFAYPDVIVKSERTVLAQGTLDFLLSSNGTRAAIQNMTWAGKQGFQTPIEEDNFVVENLGTLGNFHTERGFTYVEVAMSGHQVPQYQPQAAFQTMEWLLGKRKSITAA